MASFVLLLLLRFFPAGLGWTLLQRCSSSAGSPQCFRSEIIRLVVASTLFKLSSFLNGTFRNKESFKSKPPPTLPPPTILYSLKVTKHHTHGIMSDVNENIFGYKIKYNVNMKYVDMNSLQMANQKVLIFLPHGRQRNGVIPTSSPVGVVIVSYRLL